MSDDRDRLAAENVLLRDALHQAQWTVEFMHNCLTRPAKGPNGVFEYAYPKQTLDQLKEWRRLAPPPDLCHHSGHVPGCRGCEAVWAARRSKAEAREVLDRPEGAVR